MSPQPRPAAAPPPPSARGVLTRLLLGATVIGVVALSLPLIIAYTLGGLSEDLGMLIPRAVFTVALPVAVALFATWSGLSLLLFQPIRRALALSPEQAREQVSLLRQGYRRVFELPYQSAILSFALWIVGGAIGGVFVLQGISIWLRWLIPACLSLIAIAINLPQLYVFKRVLADVADYFRSLLPQLTELEQPPRRTISQKLRVGFVGMLIFALGMAFITNYVHLERVRQAGRVQTLRSVQSALVELLRISNLDDGSEAGRQRMGDLLGGVKIGESGGVILIERGAGEVLLNQPGIVITETTRKGIEDGLQNFGTDLLGQVTFLTLDTQAIGGLYGLSRPYWIVLALPYEGDQQFMLQAMVIYLIMLFGSIAVAVLISQDLVRPLRALLRRTERVAEGSLEFDIPFVSDDEVGELIEQTRRMVGRLHGTVTNLRETFEQLQGAADQIGSSTDETSRASADQLVESEQTSRSIASLHQKIEQIVRQVNSLQESVEKASSGSFELASTAGQVRETAAHLEKETNAIAGSTRSLDDSLAVMSKGIEGLKEVASETEGAISKIDSAMGDVREVVGESERLSAGVLEQSQQGRAAVLQTLEGIGHIQQTVGQAADVVRSLGRKSKKIGQILDVINTVADQTNLLSFNAAIIAAQAGEQGRGFAVVADEIRKLAEQTAASTGEIADLIETVQRESAQAVEAIERGAADVTSGSTVAAGAGRFLEQITKSAEESLDRVRRIVEAMEEEARQSETVGEVVGKLRTAVEAFAHTEQKQRQAGATIVRSLGSIQELARRVSRAAEEQKRAAEEVSHGIADVQHTMETVIEGVQQEAMEAEHIQRASQRIRALAESNTSKARHMEEISQRLNERAAALRDEISRFQL